MFLVPLLTDSDVTELPASFASAPMVDVRGSSDSNSNKYNTHIIAEGLIKLLQKADQQNQFCLVSVNMS